MKNYNLLDRYLLVKPRTRMLIEWPILIIVGIIGTIFSFKKIPLFPIPNVIGIILLIVGIVLHQSMHKVHKQAHEPSGQIKQLITEGIYSKIRHPGYISLILIFIGFALTWGIMLILVPAVIFTILTILTAVKEETALREKFKEEYEEYAKRVPWRFIPNIL